MTARDAWTAAFLVAIFAPAVVRLFASERQSLGAVASVRTWARATRSIAGDQSRTTATKAACSPARSRASRSDSSASERPRTG